MSKKKADRILLGTIAVLILFGFFMLASAFLGPAAKNAESFYSSFFRQLIIGFFGGGAVFLFTSFTPYSFWKKISLPFFLLTFFLTILVFIPGIGVEHAGAKRWVDFGGPFSFQPSEFLKFGFLVYLASWLASRNEEVSSFKYGLFPFMVIIAFVGFILVMEPNISTLIIILITAISLFFMAGGRFAQIAVVAMVAIITLLLMSQIKPYLKERVIAFLNRDYDPQGQNYQFRQAEIAFGSGGIFGKGFGMSIQKFNYLPEPTGDSIFAIIGEEFGFLGTAGLIILFLLFAQRGLLIAARAPDNFGRLLSSGIVIMITGQSFMNMAAMTGIIPLTGLPLIFISQGGSALVFALAEVGVLVNISKHQKIK